MPQLQSTWTENSLESLQSENPARSWSGAAPDCRADKSQLSRLRRNRHLHGWKEGLTRLWERVRYSHSEGAGMTRGSRPGPPAVPAGDSQRQDGAPLQTAAESPAATFATRMLPNTHQCTSARRGASAKCVAENGCKGNKVTNRKTCCPHSSRVLSLRSPEIHSIRRPLSNS